MSPLQFYTSDDLARRVQIQQTIAVEADQCGDDLRPYRDEHERIADLSIALGEVALEVRSNQCLDLDAALQRVGGEVLEWLEARSREAAR